MASKTLSSHTGGYTFSGNTYTLVNPAGVTIGSTSASIGIDITGTGDTLVNAGVVIGSSTAGVGVAMNAGGTVTNLSGGTITGGGWAVQFKSGTAGRVVINPGALFVGELNGGNTIGSSIASALEFAGGLGTVQQAWGSYTNFAQVTIDSGGTWTLPAQTSLGAGVTLTNQGVVNVAAGSLSVATLVGTGYVGVGSNATLALTGTVATTETIALGGTNALLTIGTGAVLSSYADGVDIFGAHDTIINAGIIDAFANGVQDAGGATIINSGSIMGGSAGGNTGIELDAGGSVTNSSTAAVISGRVRGIYANQGAATVVNLGTVIGVPPSSPSGNSEGVLLEYGGSVTNGQSGSAVAQIYGYDLGVYIGGPASGGTNFGEGTVTNFGTIRAGFHTGVVLGEGGVVVNGASGATASAAYIVGGGQGVLVYFRNSGIVPNRAGTITNFGTIKGNYAVQLNSSGTVVNAAAALLTGYVGVQITDAPGIASTLTNAGTIIGTSGTAVVLSGLGDLLIDDPGAVFQGFVLGNAGTLELASGASVGTLTNLGSQYQNFSLTTIDSGAQWTLTGTDTVAIATTLSNSGTLNVAGTLNSAGMLINNKLIVVNSGTLAISTLSGSGTIAFGTGTGDVLAFSSAAASAAVVSGMTIGQTIDLIGQTITATDLINTNTLQISLTNGGPVDVTLDPNQSYTGKFFHFLNSGGDGFITEDTTPCYLAGTRIRTDQGEIVVEHLKIGDCVSTLSGEAKPIKWIGTRSYSSAFAAGNRDIIPILIKEGALGRNVPRRDLYVSPLHAMFFDDVLIQAEHLVNGASIQRCPEIDPIRYFHIELEQHDVIFAEGAPAETFVDCDSRGMFHNAAEFSELYPADDAPRWQFCAPRIESGPVLAQVRRMIDTRAGLVKPDAAIAHGPLQGNLDGLDGASLTGWAFDPTTPDSPVTLEVLDGDGLIARVTANRFRGDLETARIGDGRHGFELRLARSLSPRNRQEIRVRRVIDGRELPGSPLVIEPHDGPMLLKDARHAIETAASIAGDAATLDGLMTTLLQGVEHVRRLRSNLDTPAQSDDRLLSWAKGKRARPKRALIVDDLLPRRDRDAGSHAVLSHIAALRSLGWQVEFVASGELARGDADAAALMAWGVKCHRAPQIASVEEVLRRNRGLFELVYLHRLSNAEAYASMVRQWQPKARVLYSVADLHHVRIARQAAVQGNGELAAGSRILKLREIAAMRLVDAVLTHSPDEAAYLSRETPGANVHVVPWALTPQRRAVPPRKRNGVAFVGGYRHAPNPDAVRWLVGEIMPLVWERDPGMPCLIVGGDWPDRMVRAFDPRVRVLDHVSRLGDVFDQIRLTVAPLRFGAGVKGKVLDSLAAGVPCVMTPIAAEGIPLAGALSNLVADDAGTIAERIHALHYRSGLYRVQVSAGLAMIERSYSADCVALALDGAITGVVPVAAKRQVDVLSAVA